MAKEIKPKPLLKKIYITNRETGNIDIIIENQVQYGYYWNWFLQQNDIKKALVLKEQLRKEQGSKQE